MFVLLKGEVVIEKSVENDSVVNSRTMQLSIISEYVFIYILKIKYVSWVKKFLLIKDIHLEYVYLQLKLNFIPVIRIILYLVVNK